MNKKWMDRGFLGLWKELPITLIFAMLVHHVERCWINQLLYQAAVLKFAENHKFSKWMIFLNRLLFRIGNHCYSVMGWKQYGIRPSTPHFWMELRLKILELKGIVVILHQFSKSKRILFQERSIFHFPLLGFRKLVWVFRKSLWNLASIQKIPVFSSFSRLKG